MAVTQADVEAASLAGRISPRDADAWRAIVHGYPDRSQATIGRQLGISQSLLSRRARRLEAAGLLVIWRHGRAMAEYRPADA